FRPDLGACWCRRARTTSLQIPQQCLNQTPFAASLRNANRKGRPNSRTPLLRSCTGQTQTYPGKPPFTKLARCVSGGFSSEIPSTKFETDPKFKARNLALAKGTRDP